MTTPGKSTIQPDDPVEHTRAYTGLWVVVAGDVVILAAAMAAVFKVSSDGGASTAIVSILTSAFTTLGTMTTAYFGIRAATNTAQSSLNSPPPTDSGGSPPGQPVQSQPGGQTAVPA